MFDEIPIDGYYVNVFFDKKNMRFYIEYIHGLDLKKHIKGNTFIKIDKYLLYINGKGHYNERNYVYNVLYYIGFDWNDFQLEDLTQIKFELNPS